MVRRYVGLALVLFSVVLLNLGCGVELDRRGTYTRTSEQGNYYDAEQNPYNYNDFEKYKDEYTNTQPIPQPTPDDDYQNDPAPEPIDFETVQNEIRLTNLKGYIEYLSSTELEGRGTAQTGGRKAAEYIREAFIDAGLEPIGNDGTYYQKFTANGGTTENVLGVLRGQDPSFKDEAIVIGAHYDHLGKKGSTIYPGADDNATGTAVLMEVAYAFGKIKGQLKRTVIFMAFSAEELGLIGSKYWVKNPTYPLKNVVYMINLDMVGYMKSNKLSFLGGGTSTYASNLMKEISTKYGVTPSITSSAGGGSDHVPFMNAGIPGVFLHTGTHAYYHKPTDTAEKINYDGVTSSAKVTSELSWRISQGEASPKTYKLHLSWDMLSDDDWYYDHGGAEFEHGGSEF